FGMVLRTARKLLGDRQLVRRHVNSLTVYALSNKRARRHREEALLPSASLWLPFGENASPPTRTMAAARNLLRPHADTRIQQLAHESCMSIRNYERRFVEDMGISPRLFARLGRFQMALDIKRASGSTWLEVAHE